MLRATGYKSAMRRPALKSIAIAVAALGTIAMLAILRIGMQPVDKPPTLPFAEIEQLNPGAYMTIDADRMRYFVVRPSTGDLYVLAAPIENGEVVLPDTYWWQPERVCRDFGLDLSQGVVTPDSVFKCRDATVPQEWSKRWRWDAQGRSAPEGDAAKVDDMYRVKTQAIDNRVIFVGLEAN